MKKVLNVISSILLYLFLALAIVAVVLTVASKRDVDGAVSLFGYQMRVVTSDSMAECELTDVSGYEIGSIPIRSMVFVEKVPEDAAEANEWYSKLKVGDVLTFRYVYTNQVTITHRIVAIEEKETGGYLIELAGDNRNSESGQLLQIIDTSIEDSTNYVIGKVVGQNYPLGYLISLLKEPIGIVLIVIVPCFLVILYEVIRIVSVVNADKRQRVQNEQLQKDNEIEELKRRLAEMEKQETTPAAASAAEKTDTEETTKEENVAAKQTAPNGDTEEQDAAETTNAQPTATQENGLENGALEADGEETPTNADGTDPTEKR